MKKLLSTLIAVILIAAVAAAAVFIWQVREPVSYTHLTLPTTPYV